MTVIRPAIRRRSRRIVKHAIERADREHAEHLAALRASGPLPPRGPQPFVRLRRPKSPAA